uniref:Uncharacterized protein n=1 Tax=Cyanothece sp. (strain PCC 7425 / ATCC 29141) TaxID=395961 RepID=B8HM10_CYAP4
MQAILDQLSPTSRYYLSKLLKEKGKTGELVMPIAMGLPEQQFCLPTAQLAKLEDLLYFHQTIVRQPVYAQNNLAQVESLIFSLLNPEGRYTSSQPDAPPPQEQTYQNPQTELEPETTKLGRMLEAITSLINEQEEELVLQAQEIAELKHKIEQSTDYERLILCVDLEAAQQNYRLLEQSLQGQRQRLQEQQNLLKIYGQVSS